MDWCWPATVLTVVITLLLVIDNMWGNWLRASLRDRKEGGK